MCHYVSWEAVHIVRLDLRLVFRLSLRYDSRTTGRFIDRYVLARFLAFLLATRSIFPCVFVSTPPFVLELIYSPRIYVSCTHFDASAVSFISIGSWDTKFDVFQTFLSSHAL